MRRTKIVATIGPASDSTDVLKQLIAAGLNVARLNFSHGDFKSHAATIARVREAEKATGRAVPTRRGRGGQQSGAPPPATIGPGALRRSGTRRRRGSTPRRCEDSWRSPIRCTTQDICIKPRPLTKLRFPDTKI